MKFENRMTKFERNTVKFEARMTKFEKNSKIENPKLTLELVFEFFMLLELEWETSNIQHPTSRKTAIAKFEGRMTKFERNTVKFEGRRTKFEANSKIENPELRFSSEF